MRNIKAETREALVPGLSKMVSLYLTQSIPVDMVSSTAPLTLTVEAGRTTVRGGGGEGPHINLKHPFTYVHLFRVGIMKSAAKLKRIIYNLAVLTPLNIEVFSTGGIIK